MDSFFGCSDAYLLISDSYSLGNIYGLTKEKMPHKKS